MIFFFYREGRQKLKIVYPSKEQKSRESTRDENEANMRIQLRKASVEWHVTKFVVDHNHNLLSFEEVRFLPSYCMIAKEDEHTRR